MAEPQEEEQHEQEVPVQDDKKMEIEETIQKSVIQCPTACTAPFANRSKQNYYSPLALNKMECWMCGMSHKRRRKFKYARRNMVDSWAPTEQQEAPVVQAN